MSGELSLAYEVFYLIYLHFCIFQHNALEDNQPLPLNLAQAVLGHTQNITQCCSLHKVVIMFIIIMDKCYMSLYYSCGMLIRQGVLLLCSVILLVAALALSIR